MDPSTEKLLSRLFPGIPREFSLKLLALYAIAQGGLFFILHAIYWDDWVLYGQPEAVLLTTFSQAGSMFNIGGYLHAGLLAAGPWLYRVLTFFLGLYSAVLFWHILNRHAWLGPQRRDLAVLFFAASPLFAAKVALIDFPYTLCLFLFLLGWHMMEKSRLVALVLFFFSFTTNSLLMLFALPMLDILVREQGLAGVRPLLAWCRRWLLFLAVPFVYWYVKTVHYKPSGLYAGYNEHFGLHHLKYAPEAMLKDAAGLSVGVLLLLVIFFVLLRYFQQAPLEKKHTGRILWIGLLAFLLSVLPYWLLGHIPTFFEWTSRHQVLMPISFALIAVWLVARLPVALHGTVATFLLALGLGQNIEIYNEYAADWAKQKTIIATLQNAKLVQQASLVVFDDTVENARQRTYRFYEWNGILRQAYPDGKQFGVNLAELNTYRSGQYDSYFNSLYVAAGHARDRAAPAVLVKIRSWKDKPSYKWPSYRLEITPLPQESK